MPRNLVTQCCLAKQIRDAVADRIAGGEYPPGHRLVELTLAKEFGTSQAPVREALKLLEGLRLVEAVPRRGTRVRELTASDLWESIVVRAGLERAAAETGAADHFRDTPRAVEELRTLNAAVVRAVEKGNLKALREKNAAFHRLIVAAAGNDTLTETWDALALQPLSGFVLADPRADLAVVPDHHVGIIDALAAGDGPRAGLLLWQHAMHFAQVALTATPREAAS